MAATNRNGGALSPVQARILEFIIRYRDQHGYTPTMREIAEDAGLKAVSSVKYQLDQLDEAGYISTKDGLARGIQILMEPEGLVRAENESALSFGDAAHIPLVGRIAAGAPILADDERHTHAARLHVLRRRGDQPVSEHVECEAPGGARGD